MNSKLSFIISLVALLGVLSVWLLWFCECIKLSVIGLDTFIGVIVALLALIFTLAIGYQIINAIVMKGEITAIKQRQDRIEENYQNYIKLASNLQSGISGTSAEISYETGKYFEAFVFYHAALLYAIKADQPNQMERIKQLNKLTSLTWKKPDMDVLQGIRQVKSDSTQIRGTVSYKNCLGSDYDQVIDLFWGKLQQLGYDDLR